MTEFATFGQELYYDESIRAIETLSDERESDNLSARIVELLPHPSRTTRLRIAAKIAQRFFRSVNSKSGDLTFARLVKNAKSDSARRDLVYWRTARTDSVIAALAGEVFYPYFVADSLPKGYDDAAFRMANTGTLFAEDRVISRDFAIRYSRDVWGFDSARSVTLALRIMKQADILDSVTVKLARRHVLGYYPQPHPVRPEVLAYCLYEEFLDNSPAISIDRVYNGDCVKVFLLSRLQVDSLLRNLEKRGLLRFAAQPGGRHVGFAFSDLDELVTHLADVG